MIVAPIIALMIFGQGLDYFKIDPFTWFENNNKIEKVNEKVTDKVNENVNIHQINSPQNVNEKNQDI